MVKTRIDSDLFVQKYQIHFKHVQHLKEREQEKSLTITSQNPRHSTLHVNSYPKSISLNGTNHKGLHTISEQKFQVGQIMTSADSSTNRTTAELW